MSELKIRIELQKQVFVKKNISAPPVGIFLFDTVKRWENSQRSVGKTPDEENVGEEHVIGVENNAHVKKIHKWKSWKK